VSDTRQLTPDLLGIRQEFLQCEGEFRLHRSPRPHVHQPPHAPADRQWRRAHPRDMMRGHGSPRHKTVPSTSIKSRFLSRPVSLGPPVPRSCPHCGTGTTRRHPFSYYIT